MVQKSCISWGWYFIPLFPGFFISNRWMTPYQLQTTDFGVSATWPAPRYSQVHLLQSDQKDHKQFRGPGQLPPGGRNLNGNFWRFWKCVFKVSQRIFKSTIFELLSVLIFLLGGRSKKRLHWSSSVKKQQQKIWKILPCIEKESLRKLNPTGLWLPIL